MLLGCLSGRHKTNVNWHKTVLVLCFRPGSNRRPCACEAHVITTTLRKLGTGYLEWAKGDQSSPWLSGAMDNASAYGAEDCRFESCLSQYISFLPASTNSKATKRPRSIQRKAIFLHSSAIIALAGRWVPPTEWSKSEDEQVRYTEGQCT